MSVGLRKTVFAAMVVLTSVIVLTLPRFAAAEFPKKSVRFVVQWAPSQVEDRLTRMIVENFSKAYDTPAEVVNKPGVGAAAMDVAAKPADGYTVGFFVNGVPVAGDDIGILGLIPEQFEPLGIFSTHPFVLVASKEAPYSNLAALTNYGKDNDVKLGHTGVSLSTTKTAIAFARNAGFEWGRDVELASANCDTLASSEADVVSTTLQHIIPCLNDVTILASITETRNPQLPDTPTLGEIDPTLVLGFWNGLFVHKDTPAGVRDKIIDVAKATVLSNRAQKLAEDTGALVYWQDAEQAAQRIVVDRGTLVEVNKIVQ